MLYLAVAQQLADTLAHSNSIECLPMIAVVVESPVQALHDFAELLKVKVGNSTVYDILEIRPKVVGVRVV